MLEEIAHTRVIVDSDCCRTDTRPDVAKNTFHLTSKLLRINVGVGKHVKVVLIDSKIAVNDLSGDRGLSSTADTHGLYVLAKHRMLRDVQKCLDTVRRDNMDPLSEVNRSETWNGSIAEFLADKTDS